MVDGMFGVRNEYEIVGLGQQRHGSVKSVTDFKSAGVAVAPKNQQQRCQKRPILTSYCGISRSLKNAHPAGWPRWICPIQVCVLEVLEHLIKLWRRAVADSSKTKPRLATFLQLPVACCFKLTGKLALMPTSRPTKPYSSTFSTKHSYCGSMNG